VAAVPDPEPAHVSEEPQLVAQVAEPGAADGPGPEIRIAEPWDGYRQLNAKDVIDRVSSASDAELAAIELFEGSHRSRRTVMAAAEKELRRRTAGR
jgi:hypothetical protein